LIGREIVQELQEGEDRAEYGKRILEELSKRLTERFGQGYSVTNLRYFRTFYQVYFDRGSRIGRPMGDELPSETKTSLEKREAETTKQRPMGDESVIGFHSALSWSHYRALMRIEKKAARNFYEEEAIACCWNKRELERQIHSFYYERLLVSKDKKGMLLEARGAKSKDSHPAIDLLKDPYVLEFLNLPDNSKLHESKLEQAIIDNLQKFLLELGKGFSFVARQKRMQFDDDNFYVDLVFYNYLLKCFVLIDLKIGELTHQDIGQMDSYIRMFEEKQKKEHSPYCV